MGELNLGTARICLEHEYGMYTLDFLGGERKERSTISSGCNLKALINFLKEETSER